METDSNDKFLHLKFHFIILRLKHFQESAILLQNEGSKRREQQPRILKHIHWRSKILGDIQDHNTTVDVSDHLAGLLSIARKIKLMQTK